MLAAVYYLLSLCLLLPFVLNCVAKVQTYLETTKQKTKNICLFNVLQQISMFLPKFIHILSTKLAKCAIYKANFFAFAEYPHTYTHVHYIKTNNKLYLQPYNVVGYIPKLPPLQRYNVTPVFHHLCKGMIYLCRVLVDCVCC